MASEQKISERTRIKVYLLSPQLGAICGIIGPLIGFLGITVAIFFSPWFNWWTDALSDLGHPWMIGGISGVPGLNPAAPIFNGGLILTGMISILCGVHLLHFFWQRRAPFGLIGATLFLISMVFLTAVGVFHEGILWPHAIAAMGFFFTLFACSFFIGIGLIRKSAIRYEGLLAILMGIIITITLFIGFSNLAPWTGAAIPEIIMAIAGFAWLVLICIRLYRACSME